MLSVKAEPYDFEFDPKTTALVMIDFQRDFVYPGGFGESLGNDTSFLLKALPPAERVLKACRAAGMFVIHTRGGSSAGPVRPAAPPSTSAASPRIHIGDEGPMGRLLVRGEHGHDIVEEVYPIDGEPIIDKPGKGAFYATDMDAILKTRGIAAHRLRRHHRGVRPDQRPRGERPRLRRARPVRLRRLVLPGVPAGGAGDDQGPGRDLRLGRRLGGASSRPSASGSRTRSPPAAAATA